MISDVMFLVTIGVLIGIYRNLWGQVRPERVGVRAEEAEGKTR